MGRPEGQMIGLLRRWLPAVELTVIGNQTYSVLERGGACTRRRVRLIAPLRMDAVLYAPAPPRAPGTNGRPRVKGERLPQLNQVLQEAQTIWQRVYVRWYDGRRRPLDVTSSTAVWYRISQPVLPVRWVLVRDPTGERTSPCLLGLYSVVALLAHALHPDGKIPIHRTAWYHKSQATFADVLAAVRRHCWGNFSYSTSAYNPDVLEIPRAELTRLAYAVCYAH